ncbi:hypothetical protein N7475_007954 [Penicillium sp. IBT 31633x]|nr:hypothetical protein N7475_007954 [Penicillium sp. IBT 31633x]
MANLLRHSIAEERNDHFPTRVGLVAFWAHGFSRSLFGRTENRMSPDSRTEYETSIRWQVAVFLELRVDLVTLLMRHYRGRLTLSATMALCFSPGYG